MPTVCVCDRRTEVCLSIYLSNCLFVCGREGSASLPTAKNARPAVHDAPPHDCTAAVEDALGAGGRPARFPHRARQGQGRCLRCREEYARLAPQPGRRMPQAARTPE